MTKFKNSHSLRHGIEVKDYIREMEALTPRSNNTQGEIMNLLQNHGIWKHNFYFRKNIL